jgi:hypothetical protein
MVRVRVDASVCDWRSGSGSWRWDEVWPSCEKFKESLHDTFSFDSADPNESLAIILPRLDPLVAELDPPLLSASERVVDPASEPDLEPDRDDNEFREEDFSFCVVRRSFSSR